jgi:hypothetical protein
LNLDGTTGLKSPRARLYWLPPDTVFYGQWPGLTLEPNVFALASKLQAMAKPRFCRNQEGMARDDDRPRHGKQKIEQPRRHRNGHDAHRRVSIIRPMKAWNAVTHMMGA